MNPEIEACVNLRPKFSQNWPFGPKGFSGKFLSRDFCLLNVRYHAAKFEKSLDQILRNAKKEKILKTHRHIDTYTGSTTTKGPLTSTRPHQVTISE